MKYTQQLFLILLLGVGFLPKFGGVDNMASQWLFLGFLNLTYFVVEIIKNKDNWFENLGGLLAKKIFTSYLLFFFVAVISIVVSINKVESLIEISRAVVLLSSIVVFHNIIKKEKITFYKISTLFTIILFVEVLYFIINLYTSFTISGVANTKGIASNINIEAISILLKSPFAVYLLINAQKITHKMCSIVGLVLGSSILFVISSRASFLALILVSVILIFAYLKEIKKLIAPLIYILVGFVLTVLYINPSISSDGGRLNNLTIINESSLTRLAFYNEAFQSILENPILGVGIGNWKIFGIEAHKEIINGYIIPYHAHNDFLQIGAEIGIIGLVLYVSIFIFSLMTIYRYYKSGNTKIAGTVLAFLGVYLIDAMLNFPISRPIIQMPLMFVLAFLAAWDKKKLKSFIKPKLITAVFIVLLIPSIVSSAKVLDSFRKQDALLKDFGAQKFDTPLEYIESIDDNYPNLGATALPIKSIKANYYKEDSVVNRLLDIASLENPFIKYPQVLKSIRFRTAQNLDSSLYYAKEAFAGIPQNELHVINYLSILTTLKDSIEADRVFDRVKKMNSINIWNAYMLTNISLERELNPRLEKLVEESIQLYPNDERFKLYKMRLTNGDSIIGLANNTFNRATELFEKNDFSKSAQLYLDASKLLPEDPAYLENAGHSYYLNNQNNKALKLFDSVIKHYPNGTGKAEYLKGLMLFETKGAVYDACKLFETAIRKGNSDAKKAKKLLCK